MAQNNKDKNTGPASDAARADSPGEGATRGDSVDETRPMKKITGNETPGELADKGTRPAPASADTEDPYGADDDQWDVEVTHDSSANADGHDGHAGEEHDELDWGERWKLTRQFASMSRSSAILMISFLLVLLLYLWVKEDPVVTLPSDQPATSETADPSATTEPTGETSATATSEVDPSGTAESSAVPTGTESADPTAGNQGSADSQVPTRDSSGQSDTQTGGNTGNGGTSGQSEQGTGTGETGQGATGAGEGQDATGGTAQGAGTGQDAAAGTGGEAGQNAA